MADLDVAGMRKAYKGKQHVLDIGSLVAKEPFGQFTAWFEEAKTTPGIAVPNAMSLATSTRDGCPSVRVVLMKGMDEKGIEFCTNYLSRKGQELTENPQASLLFYWSTNSDACHYQSRQVRIEGKVEKMAEEESRQYFHSRPRSSQISACVSVRQSSRVASREALDQRSADLNEEYADESSPIPKPDYWGGFRVVPHRFEFWQGRSNRIHDRIVFRQPTPGEVTDATVTHQGDKGWLYERLMP